MTLYSLVLQTKCITYFLTPSLCSTALTPCSSFFSGNLCSRGWIFKFRLHLLYLLMSLYDTNVVSNAYLFPPNSSCFSHIPQVSPSHWLQSLVFFASRIAFFCTNVPPFLYLVTFPRGLRYSYVWTTVNETETNSPNFVPMCTYS